MSKLKEHSQSIALKLCVREISKAMLVDYLEVRKQKPFQLKIIVFSPTNIMNSSGDTAFLDTMNSNKYPYLHF